MLLSAPCVQAQGTETAGTTMPHMTVVTGLPFTATRIVDFEPGEGSHRKASHVEQMHYRDSAGRTRYEFPAENKPLTVQIEDVVAGYRYRWAQGETTAERVAIATGPPSAAGEGEAVSADSPAIEGLATRHTRTYRDLKNGTRETIDTWYSPELHVTMLNVIERPDVGKTTYRLQNLKRVEPDAALLQVPAGLKVSDPANLPPPPPVKDAGNHADRSGSTTTTAGREAPREPAHQPYMDDPKFQKALAQAKVPRQTNDDRLENWKHANKVAGGQCIECLHQMIKLQIGAGAAKDAVKSAEQLEALAGDDPHEKYFAEAMRGGALMSYNYGQPKPEQVTQAEAAFHDVLAYSPKSREVTYQEGRALAMLGRNEEARAMFDRYVEMVPASDRFRARAERFSDDPHLATLQMAPPFRLVTSQGEELQLDDMNGRVVLLDFWATWCGPCKETLPEMQHIAKDFANDPTLVIISVSQDDDASAWKAFVAKNNMNWPQYRDGNKSLGTAYGVTSIPRFFTIDTNGVLKSEQVGSGADVRSVVNNLVKKAHKVEAQKTKAVGE